MFLSRACGRDGLSASQLGSSPVSSMQSCFLHGVGKTAGHCGGFSDLGTVLTEAG